jgi:methionyl-tRNA formyltransferase
MPTPRIAFAGDRDVAVRVLRHLTDEGVEPLALLVPEAASHAAELRALCPALAPERIVVGRAFADPAGLELLARLDLDVIVCVHFPLIVPEAVLELPRHGALNLHPAYLPWGRGWHTPSWAILEGTPAGATLHFMDTGLDSGDIVDQERLEIGPGDTAHTLYARLKDLELEIFERAWPLLAEGTYERRPQPEGGSQHRRADLLDDDVQRIDPQAPAQATLQRLRALTTDRWEEAAFYEVDGRRFRVRVEIREDRE